VLFDPAVKCVGLSRLVPLPTMALLMLDLTLARYDEKATTLNSI